MAGIAGERAFRVQLCRDMERRPVEGPTVGRKENEVPFQHVGSIRLQPQDSPDAEHAAASTMANAASFVRKTDGGRALPVTLAWLKLEPR